MCVIARRGLGLALFGIAAAVCGVTGTLQAAEVSFSGYTNGAFGVGAIPPNTSALQTATSIGLSYQNSTFSGTSASGFVGLGAAGTPIGTQDVDNLGSFSLSTTPASYAGQDFNLRVSFGAPTGIAGSNTAVYVADLFGTVASGPAGGVLIDFNNTPTLFAFSNGLNAGSFVFTINDVALAPGTSAVPLTGQIDGAQQTPVPEPSAFAVVAAAGAAGAAVRRGRRAR